MIAPLPRPPAVASAGEYEQWFAENPAPDLQAFVRQHGDWRRLPPDVWASFTPQEQEDIKANGSYRAVTPAEWAMLPDEGLQIGRRVLRKPLFVLAR